MAQLKGERPDPDDTTRYGYIFGGPGSGTYGMILDPGGAVILGPRQPPPPAGLPYAPAVEAAATSRSGRDVTTTSIGNTPVRILTETVDVPGRGTYTVQIVQDRTTEQNTLQVIQFVLLVGGLLALGVRWQLAFPWETMPIFGRLFVPEGGQVSPEFYTMLFTMHATVMIFLVIIPILAGAFGNFLIPLMIGADDMAFPTLNMLSYWFMWPAIVCFALALGIGPEACLLRPTVAGRAAHVNSSFSASLPAGEILKPAKHAPAGSLSIREQRLLSAYVSRSASRMAYPLRSIGRIRALLVKLKFELHQRVLPRLNPIRHQGFRFGNASNESA